MRIVKGRSSYAVNAATAGFVDLESALYAECEFHGARGDSARDARGIFVGRPVAAGGGDSWAGGRGQDAGGDGVCLSLSQ